MISLNRLVKFVFPVVELFTHGSARESPNRGMPPDLMLVGDQFDGLEGFTGLMLMLMDMILVLVHGGRLVGDDGVVLHLQVVFDGRIVGFHRVRLTGS